MPDDAGIPILRARFPADRGAYVRGHLLLALLGSIVTAALLLLLGSPHVWAGPAGSCLAIAARGAYRARAELSRVWDLEATALVSSDGQSLPLAEVTLVRRLGASVQVVTRDGEKALLRHLADPETVRAEIAAAAAAAAET